MNKLKFVGGCVDRIEAMTNIFEILTHSSSDK